MWLRSLYQRLCAAYDAECKRQTRLLRRDIERTKAIVGPDHPTIRAAEAFLRQGNE